MLNSLHCRTLHIEYCAILCTQESSTYVNGNSLGQVLHGLGQLTMASGGCVDILCTSTFP